MSKESSANNRNQISMHQDYTKHIRDTIHNRIDNSDMTLADLADKAELSFSTLNSLLYGSTMDCKLSTAIHISKALGISIDELVGAHTLRESTISALHKFDSLPERAQSIIRWSIDNQYKIYENQKLDSRIISVMRPHVEGIDIAKVSDEFFGLDLSKYNLDKDVLDRAYMGVYVTRDSYIPTYVHGDIILIAKDRDAVVGEHVLVCFGTTVRILEKGFDGNYLRLRDKEVFATESDITDYLGYICGTVQDN